jgi:hypothetical protein
VVAPLVAFGSPVWGKMHHRHCCSLARGPLAIAVALVLPGGRPGVRQDVGCQVHCPQVKSQPPWRSDLHPSDHRVGAWTSQRTKAHAIEHASSTKRTEAQVRPRTRLASEQ